MSTYGVVFGGGDLIKKGATQQNSFYRYFLTVVMCLLPVQFIICWVGGLTLV